MSMRLTNAAEAFALTDIPPTTKAETAIVFGKPAHPWRVEFFAETVPEPWSVPVAVWQAGTCSTLLEVEAKRSIVLCL